MTAYRLRGRRPAGLPGHRPSTTLPDANGKTSTVTGDSCTSGWVEQLHPFLEH
ncbi:hypothetical protein [Micromonospora sp. B9E7]|uniref:hypothetical protein n=1 Tax=Micromonospora sp. B9E7 TaxID=3153574 RepID=UPI00325CBA0E